MKDSGISNALNRIRVMRKVVRTQQAVTTIVIFGASGDLAGREIAPAIHSLMCEGMLPHSLQVIGVAKDRLSDESFRTKLADWIKHNPWLPPESKGKWAGSAANFSYIRGDLEEANVYRSVARRISEVSGDIQAANCLFHLAVPPDLFCTILGHLKSTALNHATSGWRRVIIEKPFGCDLRSSRALERQVRASLDQRQVFRMDHFLGKESVQNMVVLRSANPALEHLWNRRFVDHVQITMAENLGIEGRGRFYDRSGALRDMVQNHLFQLLSLTAMDAPSVLDSDGLQKAKAAVLKSLRPLSPGDAVLGQYEGYLSERFVRKDSPMPTYAALRVWIDNQRWRGVPFYLRTGKKMAKKLTEIVLVYKNGSPTSTRSAEEANRNYLVMSIQPDESLRLGFATKVPGLFMKSAPAEMVFDYKTFRKGRLLEAYERLLYAAANGDQTFFVSDEFEELAWAKIDQLIKKTERDQGALVSYKPNSWGPREAAAMLARDGRSWHQGIDGGFSRPSMFKGTA